MRVAIIGCGKISDQHVQAIRRINGCEITAVCDREPLMARQLAERFVIPRWFGDPDEMLRVCAIDVVHITTPPQSHETLARQCLLSGRHVYLEKPFTVDRHEAERIIALAARHGLKITVGHNYQFTPEMMAMRRLVRSGYLGGRPVHVESHWSYDLGDLSYVGPLLNDATHWVRQLPGRLLHNIVSHGLARIVEFLPEDIEDVSVLAFQSPKLQGVVPDVFDELRVVMRDAQGTTALFCFTTQVSPPVNRLAVYGARNSLVVDLQSGSMIRQPGGTHKSYLTFVVPPVASAREHLGNGVRNAVNIARQRLYQDSGMRELFFRFYECIRGGEPPLPMREILGTARLMDDIFARAGAARVPVSVHTHVGQA